MFTVFLAASISIVPIENIAPILPDHTQPKYSNNEQHLAYLAPDARGAYNLHVDGKCLTHERRAISHFFWEPNDEHLLYLYDEKGTENHHLFRVNLEGLCEDLTPFPNIHVEFVTLSESVPSQALIMANLRDPRYMDCYQIDLYTKAIHPVLPLVNCINSVFVDENLLPLVCTKFNPDGQKCLEVYENEDWHPLWTLDPDDWYPTIISLSPDKQKVIFLTSTGSPTRSVFAIDLKTGTQELLFSHPRLDCLKSYFNPNDGTLQATLVRDGLLEWHFFDDEFQAEIQGVEKKLCSGEITLLSRLSNDRKWLLRHRQDDSPTAYYLLDRENKDLKLVLQEAPQLLQYRFGKMESFHFEASDGQSIQGYFLRPPHGQPPYPTILQVHGGPHLRDYWGFIPQSQYWANQGYASLFINYRGSSGFGKQFTMSDSEEWGKRVFQDLIDGKHWAEQNGLVDPNRVIISGESFGGYLALLGISLTPDEFVCGIASVPLVEPSTWIPQGYVPWGFIYNKLFQDAAIGANSPLNYINQIKVPLLIVHSQDDHRVRLSQSQRMVEALEFFRKPFIYHVFSGDGHEYLDPDNRLYFFKEVEAFISKQFERSL
ncbi:MAG: S9 family peptidase [Simkaniaceae bacterium]|nr:MAG: S9 family peptidase [Simkaniaceae bacterium]